MFTVITEKRVLRVNARSIQQLTQALRAVGISYLAIHEDTEQMIGLNPEKYEGRYWGFWPDDNSSFGPSTVGIVDEEEGGVILYCDEGNLARILRALREDNW